MPRVQLIRELARTIEKADLSADDRKTMPQVSSTVGRHSGGELIPTLNDLYRCAQSRIPMGATGFRVASGVWVLGRFVDGMNLKSLVGEVNHHKVLIQVAVHKNLATLCIDNNSFDIGNKAQGPLNGFNPAAVVQASNFQS